VEGKAMQELIKAMKALSDETRLRIMHVLLERECCVCEVMQALEISQTRASRNLGILQGAGFLKTRREGAWILYSIDPETANEHANSLVKLLKESTVSNQLLAEDRERLKRAKRTGTGCQT
jgi:ArsR family transcriptional regulator